MSCRATRFARCYQIGPSNPTIIGPLFPTHIGPLNPTLSGPLFPTLTEVADDPELAQKVMVFKMLPDLEEDGDSE